MYIDSLPLKQYTWGMSIKSKVKVTVYLERETLKALKHYLADNEINQSEAVDLAIRQLTGSH